MIGQGHLVRRRYLRRELANLRQVCASVVAATPGDNDPLQDMAGWLADIQSLRNAADPLVALWADGPPSAEAIRQAWGGAWSVIQRPATGPYEPWAAPLPAPVMTAWQDVLIQPDTGRTWPAYSAATATIAQDAWRLAAHVLLEQALAAAETATVILEMEPERPTLLPADLEGITADVRRLIQAAIAVHRAMFTTAAVYPLVEGLRDLAAAVGGLAGAALARTPPIVLRTVPATMTLIQLAHQWYGDYRRAADLRRLNPELSRRPLTLRAGESVRAYVR